MKILVVSNYRGLHTARPEAEIFIGLKQLGHDITIMTYADAEYISRFVECGIKVIPNHPVKRYDHEFIKELKLELKNGYDILQLYNNKAITNGIKAAKKIDVKVVIYRGAAANMAWYNPINYFKFFHPRIDYAICNSDEIRGRFHAVPFYKKSEAITIHKGHKLDWYADTPKHDIKAELGILNDGLLFVIVANNRSVKAVPDLIKAMKLVPQDTKMSLLIIGNGMDTPELNQLGKASGNEEKIHFLGYRKDALNIVASCDVFVLTSTGGESLTKSVIEAMALGVVPLITDIPGNKPLVNDNVNGFLFKKSNPEDLADKINMICMNKHVLPDFSKATQLKIERNLNSDETVRRYDEFYRGK